MRAVPVLVCLAIGLWCTGLAAQSEQLKNEKEFLFAKKLLDDRLYELAGEQFLLFVEQYPTDEKADEALFFAGEAFFNAERFLQAFQAYKELGLTFPNSRQADRAAFRMAECRLAENDFAAAAKLFQRVAELYPKSEQAPAGLLESGKAYRKAGDFHAARTRYLELIGNYPQARQRLQAHLEIVDVYITQKKFEDALAETERIFRALGTAIPEPDVLLLRARIFEKLGQTDAASEIFRKLASEFGSRREGIEADYHLGSIQQSRGNHAQALLHYDRVIAGNATAELKAQAHLKRGDILFSQKDFAGALADFQKIDLQANPALAAEVRFKTGACHAALEQHKLAEKAFAAVISAEDSSEFMPQAYFSLVETLVRSGQPHAALSRIAEFKRKFEQNEQLARIFFREAEILENVLADFTRAQRAYDKFIGRFPHHPNVDAAQFALARCYEKLNQYPLALREYENYLQRYPAGEARQNVEERVRLISNTSPAESAAVLQRISVLFGKFATGDHPQSWHLELGRLYFEVHDFEQAIIVLKRGLAASSNGAANAEGFFYLGQSYFRLAEKSILAAETERASVLFDSAAIGLNYLLKHFPDFPQAEQAEFLLTSIHLRRTGDRAARLAQLNEYEKRWQQKYPQGEYLDHILLQLADLHLELRQTGDATAPARARQLYDLIEKLPASKFAGEASFKKIKTLVPGEQDSTILAQLNQFITAQSGSPFLPEALLLRARVHNRLGNLAAAVHDLEQVQRDFFYSDFAVQARVELAEIRMQQGEFSSATELLDGLEPELLAAKRLPFDPAEVAFKRARAYRQAGEPDRAVQHFVSFLQNYPDHRFSGEARLEIAGIARDLQEHHFAREYYLSILNSPVAGELQYRSHIALGDLFFDEKKYAEARNHYLAALKLAPDDAAARYPSSQSVRCLYHLREFAGADSDARVFSRKYKDSAHEEGLFLLDKGNAYLAEKNFEQAEKVFKKLKDDYKNSDLGAQGEFGLGAVYLITNHTEDALKTLTAIPEKYPDSEVTPLTYYNLGDFYYKSQQLENAMHAFRQVLVHPKAGEYEARALLYLAKCYNDARMWDQAIAVTREFLNKFPLSEENFRKKMDLAIYLMNLKEYQRAIAQLQELLPYAEAESEAEIQFYIGQCYNEMGNFERAVAEYLKVRYLTKPTKLPWHVTAMFEAGRCLLRLEKTGQAKQMFEQIVREQGAESNFGRFARKQLDELNRTATLSDKNPGD